MGRYNIENGEIRGYCRDGKAICLKCMTNEDWESIRDLEKIVTIEDQKQYTCQKCGGEL